ncbi:hypothetical protein RJ640_009765 [Escallonia rubra]|uniref:Uncharacterized protein n=1 Tax=Escallonia rubra TaxID=112253 RepID=A0AA88U5B5_9ASTE|nr:hypothetical protein RJ640_009763 [Escallonia rubra]KAK2969211.1 hypothetical protein RJ640_009764 [Escallonia rubra]KAK2969212.1 hypothetical protein RJ640_009765 [Escallonia rubra]
MPGANSREGHDMRETGQEHKGKASGSLLPAKKRSVKEMAVERIARSAASVVDSIKNKNKINPESKVETRVYTHAYILGDEEGIGKHMTKRE